MVTDLVTVSVFDNVRVGVDVDEIVGDDEGEEEGVRLLDGVYVGESVKEGVREGVRVGEIVHVRDWENVQDLVWEIVGDSV